MNLTAINHSSQTDLTLPFQPGTVTPGHAVCVQYVFKVETLSTSGLISHYQLVLLLLTHKRVKFNKSFIDLHNTGYICNYMDPNNLLIISSCSIRMTFLYADSLIF